VVVCATIGDREMSETAMRRHRYGRREEQRDLSGPKTGHRVVLHLRTQLLHTLALLQTGTARTTGVGLGEMDQMTADAVDVEAEQRISGDLGEKRRGETLAGCRRGTMGRPRQLVGRGGMRMDLLRSMSRREDAVDGRTSTVYYGLTWLGKHSDGVWELGIPHLQ